MFSICKTLSKNVGRSSHNLIRSRNYCSAHPNQSAAVQIKKKKFEEKIINTKSRAKCAPRQPLVKNFFLGNVDLELLSFPEVINRDDMSKLDQETKYIENYFKSDTWNSDPVCELKADVLDNLRNLGVLGLNIQQIFDGKEYCWSESLKASQYETEHMNIANFLLPHRIVCDVINTYGTDQQKEKYLSQLANGTMIGADAILELNNQDNQYFNTSAEYDSIAEQWTLNGEKSFLTVGSQANLLLVMAETPMLATSGTLSNGVTLFVVESTLPGIQINEAVNSFSQKTVTFNNVCLLNEHVIGKPNEGAESAQLLLQSSRLRSSLIGFGLMKNMLNKATKYVTERKSCGVQIREVESVTTLLAKNMCNAYATESLIYYTSGLMDEFENQDTEIETAIVKLFTLNNLWNSTISLMDFMGPSYFLPDQNGAEDLRNIAQLCTDRETVDSLRIFISLVGLKHAGLALHENIKKQRNPLFNPGHMINKFFQSTSIESPNTKMLLNEHLHPSLEPAAQCLEHSIYRLQACVEILLSRYGNQIVEKHSEIKRLSEMVTLIYATFACLSRSSRSYCIGLRLADHEIVLASAVALMTRDRVKQLSIEIEHGPFITNDKNYERVSKQLLQSKGYFSENPLQFNF